MIEFVITYWLVTLPTAITRVVLLGILKKMRGEKTRKEKSLVPAVARRKQQG